MKVSDFARVSRLISQRASLRIDQDRVAAAASGKGLYIELRRYGDAAVISAFAHPSPDLLALFEQYRTSKIKEIEDELAILGVEIDD